MSTWKYIGALTLLIASVMAATYANSEIREIEVTDKFVKELTDRKGRSLHSYVIQTNSGDLPILTFPLIGYSLNADQVYTNISIGQSLQVRVGQWPPKVLGIQGKPYIMQVY